MHKTNNQLNIKLTPPLLVGNTVKPVYYGHHWAKKRILSPYFRGVLYKTGSTVFIPVYISEQPNHTN